MSQNVLIIGSGGREHALGWKLKQSPDCGQLYFAPGNAGTQRIGNNVDLGMGTVTTKLVDAIDWFCRDHQVKLVIIGPEDPLAEGLADQLTAKGLRCFGPTAEAARLEADKAWAKKMMRAASIPTAEHREFTHPESAKAYVTNHETPVVVKAAGLAKGKGVIVCDGPEDAEQAVHQIMVEKAYGDAGRVCIVEERLVGQEASIIALVDGHNIYMLEAAQDHKPVGEADTGPNTGGMGAYTPTPLVDDALMSVIQREIMVPIVDAMQREDITYKGVLYAGLMLTAGGPKVLEFNCRFGDPECQPLMLRMRGDLLAMINACIDGNLDRVQIDWSNDVACCVVMCSGGYPGDYTTGQPITGLDDAAAMDDVAIFHAGTRRDHDQIVTAGGRVLNVTATAPTLAEARNKANEACAKIHFEGAHHRRDIGSRVIQ